jgi:hypothetical protein
VKDKKKIGILTFHNAHNFGAVLQAYALKTKLTQMGYEVSVLNYRNKYIARLYRRILHIDFWKRDVLPSRWKMDLERIGDVFYGLAEWQRRWEKFETFIDKNLLADSEVMRKGKRHSRIWKLSDVEKSDCDIYIHGSDQIWCRELTHGFDTVYFGQFSSEKPKISYAASVSDASIPDTEKPYFKEYMKAFRYISVREEKLAASLAELTQREVETVIDPTLLLQKEDYDQLLKKMPLVQEAYILVYYVVESDVLAQCAEHASQITGLPLVEIHFTKTPKLDERHKAVKGTMVYDADPAEFITYVRDAKLVLTNSFHGTVFSILFQKKFYSVYGTNGRIDNLLHVLGLEDRHITGEEQIFPEVEIVYSDSTVKLEEYRKVSVDYLKKAIEG